MGQVRSSHKPDQFQQEAINCRDRGIRIVAPAGSGKTETIARRAAARIKSGVDPRRILIVTFDNSAKRSLDWYMGAHVPRNRSPQIKTLNQVGKDILRKHFPPEHQKIVTGDAGRLLQNRYKQFEDELPVLEWDGVRRSLVRDIFQALKNQGFAPGRDIDKQALWLRREYLRLPNLDESASVEDFWGMPKLGVETDAYESQIMRLVELYGEYDQSCREMGVMDYSDQKLRAFYSLLNDRKIRQQVRSSYDEVVVDECQDLNRVDALLMWSILGEDTTLVLAGDDDQTLYEFRNAHSLYLREPERFFTDRPFTTVHLSINYRSPQAILGHANALIAHNVERIEKSPVSGLMESGEVNVLPAVSPSDHTRKLLQVVRDETGAGTRLNDIAFLCHDDGTRREMLAALRGARIPVYNTDRRSGPLVSEGVEVLNFRKAKGQQWPVVILPNNSDRAIPDERSLREGLLESVRRQYYVAMTRASRRLVIGYVRADDTDVIHRTSNDEVVGTNGASRFLFEAGLVGQVTRENSVGVPTDNMVSVEASPTVVVEPAPEPLDVAPPQSERVPPATEMDPDSAVEKVEVIVAPVVPPVPPPAPAKKRRATKPWELRQHELKSLHRASELWEKGDHEFAIVSAWKPVEGVLTRVVKLPPGTQDTSMVRVISRSVETGAIEPDWADHLHVWRKIRNQAVHESSIRFDQDPARRRDAFDLVARASEFLAYLAQRVAPKQVDLETRDDHLHRLSRLVEMIARNSPMPRTGKPLKALRFDPDREAIEMIPLQFLMMLRDIRFYTPEQYRWTTAPLMGRFLVDVLGGMPAGIRPLGRHGSIHGDKLDEERVYGHLRRLLELEAGEGDQRRVLEQAVSDALRIGNGNFHAGLKLNPRKLG